MQAAQRAQGSTAQAAQLAQGSNAQAAQLAQGSALPLSTVIDLESRLAKAPLVEQPAWTLVLAVRSRAPEELRAGNEHLALTAQPNGVAARLELAKEPAILFERLHLLRIDGAQRLYLFAHGRYLELQP